MSPLESVLLAQKNVRILDASIPYQQEQNPIGLAIAEHIVNAHRGTFDRYSTPEDGRGFRIVLPNSSAK